MFIYYAVNISKFTANKVIRLLLYLRNIKLFDVIILNFI